MKSVSVDLRSYGEERPKERHGFVQLVLPVAGQLEIDVCGLQETLSPSKGVLIHRDALHTQKSDGLNRSLIVDVDENSISAQLLDKFSSRPFIDLSQRTLRLVDYMRHVRHKGNDEVGTDALWASMLMESLANENPDVMSRLSALKALMEIDPFMPWSLERMADHADISVSRLHAIFREEFDETPHIWLSDTRMKKICALLAHSSLAIAEIADRAGFSDQTALTRAMKKMLGTTPAAYRRANSAQQQ